MTELIDLATLAAVPLARQPFEHIVVPHLLAAELARRLSDQFPDTQLSGLVPADSINLTPELTLLTEELSGPEMTAAMSLKFGLDLSDCPTMVTLRSRCQAKDGRIHTDSERKVVSALLYLNPGWIERGGRLRMLRSGTDLEDYAAEVAPEGGTFVAFRRSDHSWHGHAPFVGVRRYIMINWMRDAASAAFETARHRITAAVKGAFR